ncbi:large ribosomal subunit protein uL14m [Trichomonascus vanleenenianus]|uniref:mitochondrial 54S ribosomal protein uL14m MRPL38 n=1 Tax=Trichomonascus vanleenenianus TaxID=2268995 RepID=UPI003EC9961F
MLYLKSMLNVIDNSGAMMVECIKVLKKGPRTPARIGDKIVVVVQKAKPVPPNLTGQAATQRVRKGDIRNAVVVRTKYPTMRPDGTQIRFEDNACVLLQKSGEPIGTRISGLVAKELKDKGYTKLVSLAPRTV